MVQAQCYQIGHVRFANAHNRVRATPIDLHSSIGLRNRATGEHDVVDIARDFPGIFRLQDPRVPHSDDLCRILQVMESDTQAIDRPVHRFEESIGGRAYLIEVANVAVDRWRAYIVRVPGVPTALMPFYGRTPDEAAHLLSDWLTRAHARVTAPSS